MQRDGGLARQVVGERCRGLEKERQVVFDAARHQPVAHVLVQRRSRRIALEHLAIAAAKASAPRVVEREFARGQEADVRHRIERALRVDIERPDAFDVVVEEVDPVRQRAAHRIEVDQSTAHAELAGRNDLRHVLVARERELRAQRGDVEPRPLPEEERERGEKRRWREPVERRRRRDHQHVAFAARHAVERREPLGNEVVVRREMIVGQRLPIGKQRDAQAGREPGQLVGEPMRGQRVRGDDGKHALLLRALHRELRERERVRRARERVGARLATGNG